MKPNIRLCHEMSNKNIFFVTLVSTIMNGIGQMQLTSFDFFVPRRSNTLRRLFDDGLSCNSTLTLRFTVLDIFFIQWLQNCAIIFVALPEKNTISFHCSV